MSKDVQPLNRSVARTLRVRAQQVLGQNLNIKVSSYRSFTQLIDQFNKATVERDRANEAQAQLRDQCEEVNEVVAQLNNDLQLAVAQRNEANEARTQLSNDLQLAIAQRNEANAARTQLSNDLQLSIAQRNEANAARTQLSNDLQLAIAQRNEANAARTQLGNDLELAIAQRNEANEANERLQNLLDLSIAQREEVVETLRQVEKKLELALAQQDDANDSHAKLSDENAKLNSQIDWLKQVFPPKFLDRDYPGTDQIPLYLKLYGAAPVIERRFYNIGSAWNRHALWTNVDHPSEWYAGDQKDNLDLAWDISSGLPIGVESGKAKIVYTSHTIEHLLNDHVQHMFNEAYRILEKGGFFRITCPDIMLYYEGYARRDPHLLLYTDAYPKFSIQDLFLNEFASQNTNIMRAGNPQGASDIVIPDEEVDRIFAEKPLDKALDHFTGLCDYELHKKAMGAHINWWHYDKIATFLKRAGFKKIRRSAHGQSYCPAIRDTRYFDSTSARFSIYVETEKD